jgi:hypothetical protein
MRRDPGWEASWAVERKPNGRAGRSIRWFWRSGAVLHLSGIFGFRSDSFHSIHNQTRTQLEWNHSIPPNSQSKLYQKYDYMKVFI